MSSRLIRSFHPRGKKSKSHTTANDSIRFDSIQSCSNRAFLFVHSVLAGLTWMYYLSPLNYRSFPAFHSRARAVCLCSLRAYAYVPLPFPRVALQGHWDLKPLDNSSRFRHCSLLTPSLHVKIFLNPGPKPKLSVPDITVPCRTPPPPPLLPLAWRRRRR